MSSHPSPAHGGRQIRSRGAARLAQAGVRLAGIAPVGLWSWMVAADPGLVRLTRAMRISLSIVLAVAGAVGMSFATGISFVQFILGVAVGGMAPMVISDRTPREKALTIALYPFPAGAAFALTALAAPIPLSTQFLFVAVLFVNALLQPFGPRTKALGMSTFMGTMLGGFLAPAPATLLPQIASLLPGIAATALVVLVLIPDRPQAALRRIIDSVLGRAGDAVDRLRIASGESSPDGTEVDAAVGLVTEAGLAAEDALGSLAGQDRIGLRQRLVGLEVALNQLSAEVLAAAPLPERERARLRLLARRMRRGEFPGADGAAKRMLPPIGQAISRVDRVAAAIAHAARKPVSSAPVVAAPAPPRERPSLAWANGYRVAAASAIGIAGGMMLSPTRWFWAALTTFTVFIGTRSSGDTLLKIGLRTFATLAGVIVGILIAALVSGHAVIDGLTAFACVFAGFYAMGAADIIFIGSMTVMLGLLYGLMGINAEQLLVLRLEETLVGGAAAFVVVLAFAPISTTVHVRQSTAEMLKALAETLKASAERLAGGKEANPLEAARAVDRRLKELWTALQPIARRPGFMQKPSMLQAFPALFACVRDAKAVAVLANRAEEPAAEADVARLEQLRSEVLAMAEMSGKRTSEIGQKAAPHIPAGPLDSALDRLGQTIRLARSRLASIAD